MPNTPWLNTPLSGQPGFYPQPPIVSPNVGPNVGDGRAGFQQSGHLFAAGLNMPDHFKLVYSLFDCFRMTALMDYIESKGGKKGVANAQWSWSEMTRTRVKGQVFAITTAFGAPTITVEMTAGTNYWMEGDKVAIPVTIASGGRAFLTAKVVSAQPVGNTQQLTLQKVDQTNWAAADISTIASGLPNSQFGHHGSIFGEGSGSPKSRFFIPGNDYNMTQIMKRHVEITGSQLAQKSWVMGEGGPYIYEMERIALKEFLYDRELTIMFGERSAPIQLNPNVDQETTTDGFVTSLLRDNLVDIYGGGFLTISDIHNTMRFLGTYCEKKEWMIPVGMDISVDWQEMLQGWAISNTFQGKPTYEIKSLGVDVKTYELMDMKITPMIYNPFNDDEAVALSSAAQNAYYNFRRGMVWLNLGTDAGGGPLFSTRYREYDEGGGGTSRKIWYSVKGGPMGAKWQNTPTGGRDFMQSANGQTAGTRDAVEIDFGSEFGAQLKAKIYHRATFVTA